MIDPSLSQSDALANKPQAASVPRPSVIQLAIKEKSALYAAYIPIFSTGGLFIPTPRDYQLGDPVYVLISLPDDPQRYPVAGKVAWVTPAKAVSNRIQGVGVVFPDDEKARALKLKIEEHLVGMMSSERSTQTI
jgi:type IV pilus assembly protein PilZ